MIDYAHSPESLENILGAVKEYTTRKSYQCIWLPAEIEICGKRPIMGEVSRQNSRLYNSYIR